MKYRFRIQGALPKSNRSDVVMTADGDYMGKFCDIYASSVFYRHQPLNEQTNSSREGPDNLLPAVTSQSPTEGDPFLRQPLLDFKR